MSITSMILRNLVVVADDPASLSLHPDLPGQLVALLAQPPAVVIPVLSSILPILSDTQRSNLRRVLEDACLMSDRKPPPWLNEIK